MVSQITNSPDMSVFKPMQGSGNNFAITKPITQQQKKEAEEHKQVKTHKLGMTVAIAAIVTGLSIIGIMKGPKGLRTFLKTTEKKLLEKSKEQKTLNWLQKQGLKGIEGLKKYKKFANTILNFTSFKDVAFKEKVTNKVPFLKKAADAVSNFAEKISMNTTRHNYRSTAKRFSKLYSNLDEANATIKAPIRTEIEKELKEFKDILDATTGSGSVNDRLHIMKQNLDGFDKKYWGQTLGDIKHFAKKVESYNKFLADDLAKDMKVNNGKKLLETQKILEAKMEKILSLYKKADLPEGEYEKLSKNANKSIKSLKKSVNSEVDKLFDKIRDIKLGSAPTDVLGLLGSFVAAGVGLAQADGKDEKLSVSLQYGIPAIGGVATSLFCATALIPAGQALIVGTLAGLAISKLGSFIDEKRKHMPSSQAVINDAKELLVTGQIKRNKTIDKSV